ncbi:phospholipase D-like domain-containing protein [Streptomyces vilmorinianum]|uniref:phospholipase D-like domain-containing protein n=1 Tax=Streptomyces vilmorinianum TaxID=3051092 RepID=UPI0010FB181D|nr:phospholipase D-like domain-containing protein [Streptomyces vilmorinianum]
MIPIIRVHWRIVSSVLLALALALPGAGTAVAEDTTPLTTGAVFNNPKGTVEEQNAVKNHITGAIGRTESGRLIRAALYALTDQDYTNALVAAHQRNVNVRVVLDAAYSGSTAAQSLISTLGTDKSARSWVHVCATGGACIATGGTNAINHNKFFTFSRVGAVGVAEDVVIQTSANQTPVNVAKYWNNAYTVVGNTELYTAYTTYFNALVAEQKTADYFTSAKVGTEKYYFFPQKTGDVVVDILRNVSCTGNTTVGTSTHESVVRVAAFALHRDEVAAALVSLANQGCSVQIVYANSNDEVTLKGHPNITLKKLNADGYLLHSKYLLVEGNYAGHPDTKWTFTGSHNLDYSSLRDNDEALLRLEGNAPHDAYAQNFTGLLGYATPVV